MKRFKASVCMSPVKAAIVAFVLAAVVIAFPAVVVAAVGARPLSLPLPASPDLNRDGIVNVTDLTPVRSSFNSTTGQPAFNRGADFNADGIVDVYDLVRWGQGFSKTMDPETQALLQTTLNSALADIAVPGATMTVVRPDGAVWVGVAGLSDTANSTPMAPGLKFRIGSVTKTFTAVLILQLVQEGSLSLDQTLESVLPGAVPNGSAITIRQLLNHTSGVFDYIQAQNPNFLVGIGSDPLRKWTPQELVAVANANVPYFAPGAGFHYSNTNYVLLGMIIEKVTHRTYAQEVTSRFIVPLGLRNTSVAELPDMPAGSTHGYVYATTWYECTNIDPSWAFATGNIVSSTGDLLVWLNTIMQGSLLDAQRKADQFTFVRVIPDSDILQYGLGLEKQGLAVGHTGDFVFGGQAAMYELSGWKFIILTNASPPDYEGFGSEYILSMTRQALGLSAV